MQTHGLPHGGGPAMRRSRTAFSLIELLVTLGVLLVLIALVAPSVANWRESARKVRCSSQLASHMQVVAVYAIDARDAWPFMFERPRENPATAQVMGSTIAEPTYALIGGLWQVPVLDAYAYNPFHESLLCPSDRETRETIESVARATRSPIGSFRGTLNYRMSMAMYLDPRALDPRRPSYDPSFFAVQTHSAVQLPAQKAAIFDDQPFHDTSIPNRPAFPIGAPFKRNAAAVDGSVAERSSADAVDAVPMPGTFRAGGETAVREIRKYDFTPHGVRGRDW